MSLAWMIVVQLLYLFSLLPWIIIQGVSYMAAYDGDVTLIGAQVILWAISLYPLIMIASSVAAWLAHRRQMASRAAKLFLIPITYILILFTLIWLGVFG